MIGCGVGVGREITDALELEIGQRLHRGSKRLYITVLEDAERVGVDDLFHGRHSITVLLFTDSCHIVTGILYLPQTVIETYLGLDSMCTTDPMEGLAFDLTVGTGQTAT